MSQLPAEVATSVPTMLPIVISYSFTHIDTHGTMSFFGDIISDGGSKVTDRGVVYSDTNSTPTLLDRKQSFGTGTGSINVLITSLTVGKTYYARTFATNASGTAYADILSAIA